MIYKRDFKADGGELDVLHSCRLYKISLASPLIMRGMAGGGMIGPEVVTDFPTSKPFYSISRPMNS